MPYLGVRSSAAVEYLDGRIGLPPDHRHLFVRPVIRDLREAFWVAVHEMYQDSPLFLALGAAASLSMLCIFVIRAVVFVLRTIGIGA